MLGFEKRREERGHRREDSLADLLSQGERASGGQTEGDVDEAVRGVLVRNSVMLSTEGAHADGSGFEGTGFDSGAQDFGAEGLEVCLSLKIGRIFHGEMRHVRLLTY